MWVDEEKYRFRIWHKNSKFEILNQLLHLKYVTIWPYTWYVVALHALRQRLWGCFVPMFPVLILSLQSTSLITTLGGGSEKCPYSRNVVIPEVSLCVTVGRDFALGMKNYVAIRELSLYPLSLLAKSTVFVCDTLVGQKYAQLARIFLVFHLWPSYSTACCTNIHAYMVAVIHMESGKHNLHIQKLYRFHTMVASLAAIAPYIILDGWYIKG